MEQLKTNYRTHFTHKAFLLSIFVGVTFLTVSLFINFYAGTYATRSASNSVNDLILSNLPIFDVDGIFIYGPLFLWLFVSILCLYQPKKIPFVLKSIALFIFIRSIFITLTHIGPFPDEVLFATNPSGWFNKFAFGGDLFFSAHTGLPFLMSLVFWDNKILRFVFFALAVFFGVIVLMGHFHYSIDVFSAFFITYSIFHIAEYIFKKDRLIFNEGIKAIIQ